MSHDPADLIREVDAALDGITPAPWKIDVHDDGHLDSIVSVADDRIGGWIEVAKSIGADARLIAAAPDLVRRLRDALVQADAEMIHALDELDEAREQARLALIDQANTEAALAEANTTIARVEDLADRFWNWGVGNLTQPSVADAIRRALKGEQP